MPNLNKNVGRKRIALKLSSRVKNNERKVLQGKDFFCQAIDALNDAVATVSHAGFFSSWNKTAENVFGYKIDEVIGKLKPSILFPNPNQFKEVILKALEQKELETELELIRKNGDVFPGSLKLKYLENEKNQGIGMLYSITDLSVVKKLKTEGELSEKKFERIFHNAKDAIIFLSKNGDILEANKACEYLCGYALSYLKNKNIGDLTFIRHKLKDIETLKDIVTKEGLETFEIEIQNKNGNTVIADVNKSVILKDSYIESAQLIIRDITKRKAAEEALKKSENFYRAILENTGTASVIVEGDMSISYVNAQFANLAGLNTHEILSQKKWYDFFEESDVKKMKEFHTQRRINPYSVPRNYEGNFITSEKEVRNVFLTVALLPGTDRSICSVHDITNQKNVENELKATKKLFDDLVQSSPIALFVINKEHKIIYWNKAIEEMTGLKSVSMIGTDHHWKPFYLAETEMMSDKIMKGETWDEIVKESRYQNMEIEETSIEKGIICSKFFKDFYGGKNKWLRFQIKPFYDLEKNLAGIIQSVEDVTERHQMRNNLENRMREFHVLYQINAHYRMIDPIKIVLKKVSNDLSLACDELGPARSRITFDKKTYTNLKKDEGFLIKIEQPIKVNNEKRGLIELGYAHPVINKFSAHLKHERKVLQVVSQTLGKHIQHREILKRHQKLVNRSVVGIFIVQDKKFQFANPKFARIFRMKEAEIVNKPFNKIIPECECYTKLTKSQTQTSRQCELKATRKDGVIIDIEISTQIIDYYGKKAILGSVQDITKLKEAQARQLNFNNELKTKIAEKTKDLQIANKRLQSLNEIKDEFIAVTSHELRSPLTAARGYLSFLVDSNAIGNIPAEAKDYLVRVYDNVEVLNNLVNNILDVSRIEMERMELYPQPTDIISLTGQVIRNLSFQANSRNINVVMRNELNVTTMVLNIDHVRMRQVLRNIIDNAIKYSTADRQIIVSLKKRGIGIQITVSDQGRGIRKSEILNIFDKFKQGTNKQAQYKGAGLGLFIARKIVELHNGMIWAESKIGKGTEFHIQLPLE